MSSFFKLLKANLGIKENLDTTTTVVDGHKISVDRADSTAPLGMRVGGIVTYPSSAVVVAQALGSLIKVSGNTQIVALSSCRFGEFTTFRAYLKAQVDDVEFLQITATGTDGAWKVEEVVLYSSFFIDFPTTEEDWASYLDGGIGQINYQNDEGTEYNRVTGDQTTDFLEPLHVTETLLYSADGMSGDVASNQFHLYERALGEASEFVLTEVTESEKNACVHFFYGIPLAINDVKFIPTNS
jgi:hypothetical protein